MPTHRLQVARNSLARGVCQAPYSVSAIKLRWHLHWLPVRQRIIYKVAIITSKTTSAKTAAYLSDTIHNYYHPASTLRSADKLLLTVPRMSLALSAKAFSVSVPSVWNSLSSNYRSAKLLSTYKRTLKTKLFDIAYSQHEHSS